MGTLLEWSHVANWGYVRAITKMRNQSELTQTATFGGENGVVEQQFEWSEDLMHARKVKCRDVQRSCTDAVTNAATATESKPGFEERIESRRYVRC